MTPDDPNDYTITRDVISKAFSDLDHVTISYVADLSNFTPVDTGAARRRANMEHVATLPEGTPSPLADILKNPLASKYFDKGDWRAALHVIGAIT